MRMTARREQVVYQCGSCGYAWELEHGRIVPKKVVYLAGNGDIRLPFWSAAFRIAYQEDVIADTSGFMTLCGSAKLPDDRAALPPELYVPAFGLPQQQAVRLGRNMAVRFPRFRELPAAGQPFEAVTLSEKDVPQMAELIVLAALVEGQRNNPNVLTSFGVELSGLHLLAIPFSQEGSRLYHMEMNLEV